LLFFVICLHYIRSPAAILLILAETLSNDAIRFICASVIAELSVALSHLSTS
jgi:hypothetical protein